MLARALRPFAAIAIFGLFTGCMDRSGDRPASDTLRTALPAAELPTFARGDSYTFDNPRETWRVTDVSSGLVTWNSTISGSQVTMFDPMLPPIRWSRPDGQTGERKILEWSGSLFPLKSGNKLTFKTAVSVGKRAGHARFIWNCYVGNPRQVLVPAGNFAAFPVFCRRNDGQKTHIYYAPALHRPIAITTSGPTGKPVSRQLVTFQEGDAERITATARESLPGDWPAAAVAKWGGKGLTGPRIKPKAIAKAHAPVNFASPPVETSHSPVDSPGKADKVRAADRKPTRKVPSRPEKSEFRAHIGSFGSRERAELGWTLFKRKFGGILTDQPHSVARIDLGARKGVTYRLYAGPFDSAATGKALCHRLREKHGYCRVFEIPKRQ